MTQKLERCSLSVAEKRNIINYIDKNPMTKKLAIANKFEIPATTFATIFKFKDKFSEERGLPVKSRRLKSCEFNDVEEFTEKTIANCFKKSGFKVTCEDEEDDLPLAELARTWQRVQEELHLQETEFEYFVTFDNDLDVCGELTDANIITSVLSVATTEADKHEEEES
ncbi:hypothetical protein HHI36_007446 [Cryptolaemus montrouzieri]|uniref:HTH psq-type domain-containing protein n=1 Tax=Cryptolaemus montrouzieri TaxID=559131 RepID=A0ABD2MPT5_9CUCU